MERGRGGGGAEYDVLPHIYILLDLGGIGDSIARRRWGWPTTLETPPVFVLCKNYVRIKVH